MHESRFLDYEGTMVVYIGGSSLFILGIVKFLLSNRYFNEKEWNILKETIAIVIILWGMGLFIYLAGFLIEINGNRWNISTFLDSFKHSFLIGISLWAFLLHLITVPFLVQIYYKIIPRLSVLLKQNSPKQ